MGVKSCGFLEPSPSSVADPNGYSKGRRAANTDRVRRASRGFGAPRTTGRSLEKSHALGQSRLDDAVIASPQQCGGQMPWTNIVPMEEVP